MKLKLARILAFVSLVVLSTRVLAQDARPACRLDAEQGEPAPEYMVAVREAVAEHGAGHFIEARAQFLRAHGLYPNARTLRGLGMVEFELRNYGESVRYLEAALNCPARALDETLAREASDLLGRARAYVGEVHVALSPTVAASIVVDGVTVASGPEASLVLVVGDHVLEFRAGGFTPERRTVQVRSGERTTLQVKLEAPPITPRVAATLDDREMPPPPEKPRLVRQWWLWTGVGVVIAGALTGALLAARREPEERAPSTTPQVPPDITLGAFRGVR